MALATHGWKQVRERYNPTRTELWSPEGSYGEWRGVTQGSPQGSEKTLGEGMSDLDFEECMRITP